MLEIIHLVDFASCHHNPSRKPALINSQHTLNTNFTLKHLIVDNPFPKLPS